MKSLFALIITTILLLGCNGVGRDSMDEGTASGNDTITTEDRIKRDNFTQTPGSGNTTEGYDEARGGNTGSNTGEEGGDNTGNFSGESPSDNTDTAGSYSAGAGTGVKSTKPEDKSKP